MSNAQSASNLIAQDDVSVMALGGFIGTDPASTVESIADLVDKGEVRFFQPNGGGLGGGLGGGGSGPNFNPGAGTGGTGNFTPPNFNGGGTELHAPDRERELHAPDRERAPELHAGVGQSPAVPERRRSPGGVRRWRGWRRSAVWRTTTPRS